MADFTEILLANVASLSASLNIKMTDQTDSPPPRKNNGQFVKGNDPRRMSGSHVRRTPSGTTLPNLARMHTEEAVNVVATILMDPNSKDKDRLQAAALLFSRGWGLPSQSISIAGKVDHSVTTTIDAKMLSLETRSQILAALRAQDAAPIVIDAAPIASLIDDRESDE